MQSENDLIKEKSALEKCLQQFSIAYEGISCICGPTYNLYKLIPKPGDKVSKIKALQEDISLSLNENVRIVILGDCIGIEIPHKKEDRECIDYASLDSKYSGGVELPVMIGLDISKKVLFEDLTEMPHLLISGATKQGKTSAIRVIIASLIQNLAPDKIKFALFDPKQNVLMVCRQLFSQGYLAIEPNYSSDKDEFEHCIARTDNESLSLLSSLEKEMEERYDALSRCSVKSIGRYHQKYEAGDLPNGELNYFPYIVAIVDELADLTMKSKKILAKIIRLAQKGRAVGIHLIVATQRPSTDVISGLVKANFPTRLAVKTASRIDSMCIIDCPGAEKLTGNGDALFSEGLELVRVQIPNLSEDELSKIISSNDSKYSGCSYYLPYVDDDILPHDKDIATKEQYDEMFKDAAIVVVAMQMASISLLQRKLSIGFAKASRIIDQLEHAGIVGEMTGSSPRKVLVGNLSELNEKLGTS